MEESKKRRFTFKEVVRRIQVGKQLSRGIVVSVVDVANVVHVFVHVDAVAHVVVADVHILVAVVVVVVVEVVMVTVVVVVV